MTPEKQYTLDEICLLGEVTKRTLRYYVQEGLIDRPLGESKRAAYYTTTHLEQLLFIRKYRNMGVSLEGIRDLMTRSEQPETLMHPGSPGPGSVEVWSRIYLSPGLEVQIEPGRAGLSPEQLRQLISEFNQIYLKIKGKEHG